MKILVTGGSGFIGSYYIHAMERRGNECLSYDLPDYDIADTVSFRLALEHYDMCVHFAAVADLNQSYVKQIQNFEVNVVGTFNIARICAQEKKPLIFNFQQRDYRRYRPQALPRSGRTRPE